MENIKNDDEDVHVRTATPQDEDGIMELARLVNNENGVFKMNDDKVRSMVRPSLYLSGGIMGVIGQKDRIEGLVLLRVSQYWYSDATFLEEMCVYVHPEYRAAKGGRARKLVEFAKKASEKLELPLMIHWRRLWRATEARITVSRAVNPRKWGLLRLAPWASIYTNW